jgi:hypothetical protein
MGIFQSTGFNQDFILGAPMGGIQGLSQLHDAGRRRSALTSHAVAALDGCTIIPRAAGKAQGNETSLFFGF